MIKNFNLFKLRKLFIACYDQVREIPWVCTVIGNTQLVIGIPQEALFLSLS